MSHMIWLLVRPSLLSARWSSIFSHHCFSSNHIIAVSPVAFHPHLCSSQVTIAMDLLLGDSNDNDSSLLSSATSNKKRKKLSHDGATTSGIQSTAVTIYAALAPAPGIQGGPQFSIPPNAMYSNPMFTYYYTQQPYLNFAASYIQQQNSM